MAVAESILIKGARVYDPSPEWTGELRDLYVAGGRISEPFDDPQHTIHAGGRPLLAGGIDPHCQLAGHGQALTRMFVESPSPDEIGRAYARMGYVHVHQPFTTLLTAGLVRHALRLIPFVDTSTCVSIDLRDMGQSIRANQPAQFGRLARALIRLTGALGLSLPFPYLRHQQRHYIQKNLSAKKVLSFLSPHLLESIEGAFDDLPDFPPMPLPLLLVRTHVQMIVVQESVEEHPVGAQGLSPPEGVEGEHHHVAVASGRIHQRRGVGHLAAGHQAAADQKLPGIPGEA